MASVQPDLKEKTSRQKIVIYENERVELVTERIEHVTSMENALLAMRGNVSETPLLPFGTILARFNKKDSDYYVMSPPKRRMITYRPPRQDDNVPNEESFDIAFPWLLFIFRFMGMSCIDVFSYGAKRPITSMDDMLFQLPLPNCDRSGRRCMGPEFGLSVNSDTKRSVCEKALDILHYFETSMYNDDLPMLLGYLPPEIKNMTEYLGRSSRAILTAWQAWTQQHSANWSRAVCELSWSPAKSMDALVEERRI
jgi:hypothetical protein